jgi:hypothetical protein
LPADRRNQILLTSQSPGKTTSELPFVMNAHKTKERGKKPIKIPSSHLHPRLSNKRSSTLPHRTQNTKHQYQDWMLKE